MCMGNQWKPLEWHQELGEQNTELTFSRHGHFFKSDADQKQKCIKFSDALNKCFMETTVPHVANSGVLELPHWGRKIINIYSRSVQISWIPRNAGHFRHVPNIPKVTRTGNTWGLSITWCFLDVLPVYQLLEDHLSFNALLWEVLRWNFLHTLLREVEVYIPHVAITIHLFCTVQLLSCWIMTRKVVNICEESESNCRAVITAILFHILMMANKHPLCLHRIYVQPN